MAHPQTTHRYRWFLLLLWLWAGVGVAWWCWQGRPVAVVDAPAGRLQCVSYAPFHDHGTSPMDPGAHVSRARIRADLTQLARHFGCVRTYAQGAGLDQVPAVARQLGLKVLLGIWLSADRAANRREIARGIAVARAHRAVIRAIVVGNEVLLRGELSPAELVADIRHVRTSTGVPVTYADVWTYWLRYAHAAGLADAVSFVTIHVLPYWEDRPRAVADGVAHMKAVLRRVHAALPGKPVLIGETGWPSYGRARGPAVAGRVNEARYVRRFLRYARSAGLQYNLIESYDQPWKWRLEGTAGSYWGLYDAAGVPKFGWRGPVVPIPRWWLGLLATLSAAALWGACAQGGWRQRLPMTLAGAGSGALLAGAARQMSLSLHGPLEWVVATAAWLAAAGSAWWLCREALATAPRPGSPWPGRLRLLWLFVAAWADLLLVFDGRYRDYPLPLVAVPALALTLHGLRARSLAGDGLRESRLLAAWVAMAACWLLWRERFADADVWLWAGVSALLVTTCVRPGRGAAGTAATAVPAAE